MTPSTDDLIVAAAEADVTLPLGAERPPDTLAWVAAETTRRAVPLAQVLFERSVANKNWHELAEAYEGSVAEIESNGDFVDAATFAVANQRSLIIVTACNPMSVLLDESENAQRTSELRAALETPEAQAVVGAVRAAVGRSADGVWNEPGFAVEPSDFVLDLSASFGQAAVYHVSPQGRRIVRLVGADWRSG